MDDPNKTAPEVKIAPETKTAPEVKAKPEVKAAAEVKPAPAAKERYVTKQEVSFDKKIYGVGERLPADIDPDILAVLKAHGAV
jgi:hypothetical protein